MVSVTLCLSGRKENFTKWFLTPKDSKPLAQAPTYVLQSSQRYQICFHVVFCILFVEANSPSNPEEHSNRWKDSRWTFSTRPTIFWTPSLGCTQGKPPWWPVIPQKFPAPPSGSTYARCSLCPEEWAARTRCTMDQQGFRILTNIF